MEDINSVYDAWKAGILDKYLAGEDGSDHSSPAILNVPTPVDWVNMTREVWGTYDELDENEKPIFFKDYETALTKLIRGSLYEIWAASYILFMQIQDQKGPYREGNLSIDLHLLTVFWDIIQSRKAELEQYYPMGKHDDSAYQDILRLDRITLNDCNTSFSTYKDAK